MYFQEFSWTDIANIYDASSFLGRLSGQSLQVRAEIVYIYDLYEVKALQVRANIASIYDASTLPGRLQGRSLQVRADMLASFVLPRFLDVYNEGAYR